MTPLLLILSLLSLDVGRSRTTSSPRSIERTIIRLGVGLAATYGDETKLSDVIEILEGESAAVHVRTPRLYLDGVHAGSPFTRIAKSIWRLAAFSVDRGEPGQSVELRYVLVYRGLIISRRVRVTEGKIDSRAQFPCAMGPQKRVKHVWLSCTAQESPHGTTITTAATVRANSGICPDRSTSRLRVVNRLAGRQISGQLDGALASAEREGRRLSEAGHEAITGYLTATINHLLRWTR